MINTVRELNEAGIEQFAAYVDRVRAGSNESPPMHLLEHSDFSVEVEFNAQVDHKKFGDFFEYGKYLVERLAHVDRHAISLRPGLWTWLSLFYFDFLGPVGNNGQRKLHRPEYYVLASNSPYTRYYKHFTRIAWLTYAVHGEFAKLLLIQTRSGNTNDYRELLTGTQERVENRIVIEAAYRLYFDVETGKPRVGASGQNGLGTIHRFSGVLRQFERTFDISSCSVEQLVTLLPREFDAYRKKAAEIAPLILTS